MNNRAKGKFRLIFGRLGHLFTVGLVIVGLVSCSDSTTANQPDGSQDAQTDADANGDQVNGVELTVSAHAIASCGSWEAMHQPELNYQTPTQMRVGIMAVELLRSHKDPAPVSLELAGDLVEVDVSAGGVVLTNNTAGLPPDTYTHIRVRVAYVVYQLQATAHFGMAAPGTLEIDMALSNHENDQGQIRAQGQYLATFTAFGQTRAFPGSTTLNCTLSEWGGIAATTGTAFDVRVPIPGNPLVVDTEGSEPLFIDLQFPIQDTFSWRDLDESGFSQGVLDISQPPGPVELPDSMLECHLLMADRCLGEAVNPIHPTWPMPDSNIGFCTDGQQVVATCPNPGELAFGQDANYLVNSLSYDIEQQVVTDLVTGLVWQRATEPTSYDWWEARDYCAALELDGASDWRLPSRLELVSLLDYGGLDPTIDLDAFPDTPSDFFWSSSPVPFLNLAYGVRFELGFIYDHDPYGTGRVRCVRGIYIPPNPRFTFDADVVHDHGSNLDWQRQHVAAMTWLDALDNCETLDLGNHGDWRLPTLKELQTLVDDRRLQPSIDIVAFPDCPAEWFWSSTPIQFPPSESWATSYTDGYASIHANDELQLVRCVRND
jgi:uncharacterized protein DUF1566